MSEPRLIFTPKPDGWAIEGELDCLNAALLRAWCGGLDVSYELRRLELAGLEILDSEGVAAAIDSIRLLLRHVPALIIAHAPHLLSHTLYRIGMLEPGGRLSLHEPRQEEPYG